MSRSPSPPSRYHRAEAITDGVVHVVGFSLALVAVPILIVRTAMLEHAVPMVVAISIYGATLLAMILFSGLYNMIPTGGWTPILRRLDHSAIYFKIAGTFTPFTLLSGGLGPYLLAAMWSAAVAGTGLRVLAPERTRRVALGLYLAMGWIGVGVGWPLFMQMPGHVLALVALGGLLYTAGFAFYLLERLPFHTAIWHVFVLAASAAFFAAVSAFVADLPLTGAQALDPA
jgi:hemolysin III